jgi:iron complex transport system ATP-binding protein
MNLQLNNLKFDYPGVPVLKNISFEVKTRQIIALVGENGTGKSTLLKCINRILEYQKGAILINGRDIKKLRRKEIAKYIAYLPQKTFYNYPFTVFDIVLAGRYPHMVAETSLQSEKEVWNTLKIFNLENIAIRNFDQLSGGQQKEVIIARAMAQKAKFLLLDEPTNDLDIRHRLKVMEVIKKSVRENDISAFLTLHDLNLAARYADRIIMLHNGMIFADGTSEEVLTSENIAEVYRVKVSINKTNGYLHIVPVSPV